jgi:prolyl oligopeptidase
MTPTQYPEAPREDHTETIHGHLVADPYRWLEDAADRRAQAWSAAQRALFEAERDSWPDLAGWERSLGEFTAVGRVTVPRLRAGREFWRRQDTGQEHLVLLVRDGGRERPLVDPGGLDPSGRTTLEAWQPSWDGRLLAYQLCEGGTERTRLWVLDVDEGRVVDGPLTGMRKSPVAWLPDGRHFYYVGRPPGPGGDGDPRLHRRVLLHALGTPQEQDVVVFGDGRDKTSFYDVSVTPDGRWLTVTATTGTAKATDLYVADLAAAPQGQPGQPGQPGLQPVQEGGRHRARLQIAPGAAGGTALLRTDEGAPRGRVLACPLASLSAGTGAWRELIPERPDATLAGLAVLSGPRPAVLAAWTRLSVSEITIHDLPTGERTGTVPLPGVGQVDALTTRPEGGHEAWFTYTDFATPVRVLRYDARAGGVTPWDDGGAARATVPGVAVSVEEATSPDGTRVQVFVLSPAARPDRPRPAILAGYGGFGASVTPNYSPRVHAWIRAGGVFAWACLRGGGEGGALWHQAGSGRSKQNTFDDCGAVADHLTARGWTTRRQLGILGGSNGGLLVGAAITQHPYKYAAAVCMSPLLDMVRYELSGLGASWVPEYGTVADPDDFRVLLSYSPYHAIAGDTAYPAVLLTVADGDTRTDPLHARKACAALQHATTGAGPIVLREEEGVGHGQRARSRTLALHAESLAFFGRHLGLPAPQGNPAQAAKHNPAQAPQHNPAQASLAAR